MRQIVLDTETTGLSPQDGHRIIEIGCVELLHRRLTGTTFHFYINPQREVDKGALRVHGITDSFLKDKPLFSEIAEDLKDFLIGGELIIHNAPFDLGFLHYEFSLLNDTEWRDISVHCSIIDTLEIARKKHPGQRNNLDALCKRYQINNQHREKHGALLDAEILADVYLAMTGGQSALNLEMTQKSDEKQADQVLTVKQETLSFPTIRATQEELTLHTGFLDEMQKRYGVTPKWRESNN